MRRVISKGFAFLGEDENIEFSVKNKVPPNFFRTESIKINSEKKESYENPFVQFVSSIFIIYIFVPIFSRTNFPGNLQFHLQYLLHFENFLLKFFVYFLSEDGL